MLLLRRKLDVTSGHQSRADKKGVGFRASRNLLGRSMVVRIRVAEQFHPLQFEGKVKTYVEVAGSLRVVQAALLRPPQLHE
jgi:hypothetical protein